MAHSNCPSCSREIPYQVSVCPHCGHRFMTVRRKRPIWVYLVFGVYALLVAFVLLSPFIVFVTEGNGGAFTTLFVITTIIFLLGASLLVIPIGTYRERPVQRKLIIVPIVGSAISAASLVRRRRPSDARVYLRRAARSRRRSRAFHDRRRHAARLGWLVRGVRLAFAFGGAADVERPDVSIGAGWKRPGIADCLADAFGRASKARMLRRPGNRPRDWRRHHRDADRARPGGVLSVLSPLPAGVCRKATTHRLDLASGPLCASWCDPPCLCGCIALKSRNHGGTKITQSSTEKRLSRLVCFQALIG